MYAVIRIEKHQQDNTGDPEVDFEIVYDVFLFESEQEGTAWTFKQPVLENVRYHLLDPVVAVDGEIHSA